MWTRGTVLGGRYTLTERVGGGAMGDVWRADDRVLERQVAVKILLPSLMEDEAFAARFRREAKVLANLDHPGIVDVYDYGEEEVDTGTEVAYIVMEFVAGRPLDVLLRERGTLPPTEALAIAAQTLDALHGAHRRKVVHRDVKPANLMVGEDGRVTVTDFGIARALTATKLTSAHEVLGTAHYIAPESAEGIATVPASDLYSVGIVIYEMLTGECPFTDEALLAILLKHIREPAPALPEGFPGPVRELVARALEKRPEDRFPSAAAMAEATRRAAAGQRAADADSGTVLLHAAVGPESAKSMESTAAVNDAVVVGKTAEKQKQESRWRRPGFILPLVIPVVVASTVGTLLLAPWHGNAQAGGPAGPTVTTSVSPRSSASSTPTASPSPHPTTASASASAPPGKVTGGSSGGTVGGAVPPPTGGATGGTGSNNGTNGGTTGGKGTSTGGTSGGSRGTSGGSSGGASQIGSAGTYRITDAADGGCLAQDTSSGAPGAYAVSSSCASGPTPYAEWTFVPASNGTFKVVNKGSGDCLTAFMANGWSNMDPCGSNSAQYWQIGTRTSSGSTIESTTYWQCLQITSAAEQQPCNTSQAAQLWTDAGSG
ncbi:serine/threonine-protein kinase [Streptacidiphilus fuscans]|uniref:non-specific serine/threonine protein kinase n=1 Tax=Streptacidiphilus fuscans TaxID=2789292 RepID=A0A931B9W6_9ACTN|nr:protein kinase [Streptacidiphilus fuscans]MBF9073945.1 protein kinase [Streptacidiphilus fuscans]